MRPVEEIERDLKAIAKQREIAASYEDWLALSDLVDEEIDLKNELDEARMSQFNQEGLKTEKNRHGKEFNWPDWHAYGKLERALDALSAKIEKPLIKPLDWLNSTLQKLSQ